MKVNSIKQNIFLSIITFFFSFIILFISLYNLNFYNLGLYTFLIAYLIFLYSVFKYFGLNSVITIFLFFFALYTFSVPISISLGLDIGKYREQYFILWSKIDFTLAHYTFSSILFFIPIVLLLSYYININSIRIYVNNSFNFNLNPLSLLYLAFISAFIATIFELINFQRVGGVSTLMLGKGFYQSALNDLRLNLPSEGFFYLSIILFFVSIRFISNKLFYVLIFLSLNSFFILINLIIGERGILFFVLIYILSSYYFLKRIVFIKKKFIVLILIFSIFFSLITVYRNLYDKKTNSYPNYKQVKEYLTKDPKKILYYLNPANIEFGSSALVYRTYIFNKSVNYEPKFGFTYFYFLPNMLPTYINPYRAPNIEKDIVNEFFKDRNTGSITGMGYSFLLESFINFWFFGPLIIGTLISIILIFLEYIRFNSKLSILLYVNSIGLLILFIRSSSQFIISSIILLLLQIIFLLVLYYFLIFLTKKLV